MPDAYAPAASERWMAGADHASTPEQDSAEIDSTRPQRNAAIGIHSVLSWRTSHVIVQHSEV